MSRTSATIRQLPLPLNGAITATVAPYAQDGVAAVDAPAFLAELLDVRGGVELAEALAALDAAAPAPAAPTRPEAARGLLRTGVAATLTPLDDAFRQAFRPRYRLPTATRALTTLREHDALTARKGKALTAATRTLWIPVGEYLDTHHKRARFGLRDLRDELGPLVAGLGPSAARLERLDAALHRAIRPALDQLLRRTGASMEQAFGRALQAAIKALPAQPSVADLEPGFSPSGWFGLELATAQRLVRALVDHEVRRLESLVEVACALERDTLAP